MFELVFNCFLCLLTVTEKWGLFCWTFVIFVVMTASLQYYLSNIFINAEYQLPIWSQWSPYRPIYCVLHPFGLAIISKIRIFIGLALITANEALLWTDGRYFLQAEQQLSNQWKLMRVGEDSAVDIWMADVRFLSVCLLMKSMSSIGYSYYSIYFLLNWRSIFVTFLWLSKLILVRSLLSKVSQQAHSSSDSIRHKCIFVMQIIKTHNILDILFLLKKRWVSNKSSYISLLPKLSEERSILQTWNTICSQS